MVSRYGERNLDAKSSLENNELLNYCYSVAKIDISTDVLFTSVGSVLT